MKTGPFWKTTHVDGIRFVSATSDLYELPAFQREALSAGGIPACLPIRTVQGEEGDVLFICAEGSLTLEEWAALTQRESRNPAADMIRLFVGLAESLLDCEDRLLDISGLDLRKETIFIRPDHGVRIALLRRKADARDIAGCFLALLLDTVEACGDPAFRSAAETVRSRAEYRNAGLRGILGILNRTARDLWGCPWPDPGALRPSIASSGPPEGPDAKKKAGSAPAFGDDRV